MQVRDYSLGDQVPVFHSVKLTDVNYNHDSGVIKVSTKYHHWLSLVYVLLDCRHQP